MNSRNCLVFFSNKKASDATAIVKVNCEGRLIKETPLL